MALNASKVPMTGSKERVEQPNLEPGLYPARLVQILDLGLQPQRPYLGQPKPPANEIQLTYELVDSFMIDKDGKELEDKPRWVSETIPLLNLKADKAKSTQRYMALDPTVADGGDFVKQIGKPVNVNIVNNKGKDGKVYDNVSAIAPMRPRDAERTPELVNPSKVFVLDEPDMEVFNALPEWLRDKIKENLNYEGSALQKLVSTAGDAPAKKGKNVAKPVKDEHSVEAPAEAGGPPFDVDDNNPY